MYNIPFISTVHREIGKCNADELHKIIETIHPEVIFLEALEDTYSKYQQLSFSSFEVFHKKLEISALQKYSRNHSFEYIPVLDNGLSDSFERKYNLICNNIEFQNLLDEFNLLASERGFQFLNSAESIRLQEEMRMFENRLLKDNAQNKTAIEDVNAYENAMIRNIYSYCRSSRFDAAIFMCGVGHRKSIIEKVEKFKSQEEMSLNWIVFET